MTIRKNSLLHTSSGFRLLGIALLFVAGGFTFSQRYLGIYANAPEEFLRWLHVMGIIMIFHSIILFAADFLNKAKAKESVAIGIIFSSIYLFMTYRLFDDPLSVPIVSYREEHFVLLQDNEFKETVVRVVLGSAMALMAISVLNNLRLLFASSQTPRR
jgi:hypothetical protein